MASGPGPDPKLDGSASALVARWRSLAPREGAPRRSSPPPPIAVTPEAEATPAIARVIDPAILLRDLEAMIAASAPAVLSVMEPIRAAIGQPLDARDPAALAIVFEQVEDILEALLLAPAPSAHAEG